MTRKHAGLLVTLLLACLTAGCAAAEETPPERIALSAWPENAYTEQIPCPAAGTPDYVLAAEDYYAVFLRDITREEGETYLDALEEAGFRPLAAEGEESACGALLAREDVAVSVSLSGGGMGIMISRLA